MKPISDFFPRLMPFVAGCSEPLATQAIVDSAIEFCEKSLVIQHTIDSFSTVAGTAAYSLDAPFQQEVARIIRVAVAGRDLYGLPQTPMPAAPSDAVAHPLAFYTTRNDSELLLQLEPIPDAAYTVYVRAALRPTKEATQLEDDLYTRWSDAVINGALARLKIIPGQAFTDGSGAMYHSALSAKYTNTARIDGVSGRIIGSMAVRSRPLA